MSLKEKIVVYKYFEEENRQASGRDRLDLG